jgi:hypothetical protein
MLQLYSSKLIHPGYEKPRLRKRTLPSDTSRSKLTDMFNSFATFDLGAKVPSYRSLKDFYHEAEE